ncbi:dihydroxyacetone kinase subunit DhaK [Actinomycetaceae bacterium WB03_NA08]|uniref:Dihydroxyacetone kinase subunit DhaK n=1 Tax=Scrofimicrobium canadense TaxID=2652290 RepID=A0A6N7VPB0_9ACTO|nr:dihydroxyacetone kinase subunit DhaK [Scrofimicrobium canadense]MSS83564.1 dihydroxyacetone kinase subunit DhaK [Scrofimicrobium canadense]
MKKLINDPQQVVTETLEGFALAYPDLVEVHFDPDWVERKVSKDAGKVGLVSGGGSGHEPLHAGYVGVGMLDAAVPGPVFTSPTPDPIVEATRAADKGAGVVHIVKNYTGDVLNFETAAELAEMDDISVETVLVDDDCAVENSTWTAGRRGVAGTVLVEKIAGAAAERGDDLATVAAIGRRVNENMRSMGLALGPCTVPHAGKPSFDLAEDEIELGIGIHGEPGYRRGHMEPADSLTEELYHRVRDDLGLVKGDRVIALVNGMGGTPESELFIVFRKLAALLEQDGVERARSLVGNYVTSLEMPGVSITLLRLDSEMEELFDAPAYTPAWK